MILTVNAFVVILTLNTSEELKLEEKGPSVSNRHKVYSHTGFKPFKWDDTMKWRNPFINETNSPLLNLTMWDSLPFRFSLFFLIYFFGGYISKICILPANYMGMYSLPAPKPPHFQMPTKRSYDHDCHYKKLRPWSTSNFPPAFKYPLEKVMTMIEMFDNSPLATQKNCEIKIINIYIFFKW